MSVIGWTGVLGGVVLLMLIVSAAVVLWWENRTYINERISRWWKWRGVRQSVGEKRRHRPYDCPYCGTVVWPKPSVSPPKPIGPPNRVKGGL